MYDDGRHGGSVFGAFLLGGIVGAVLGLLFAPRSGQETREMLAEKADEYWGEAGEFYETGMEKVTEVVATGREKVSEAVSTGKETAAEKGEVLRSKIDEARVRLQEQVAKSTESAKGKVAEFEPAAKDVVDKAAEATKSGVETAAAKAQDTLDFVAKKAAVDGPGAVVADIPVSEDNPLPHV